MKSFSRWIGTESFWFTVLLVGSLILRLATMGIRPFDGDEGVVLAVITQPTLHQALALAAKDVHPLLLFALAWLPVKLFGVSTWSARLLPAIFSVGIIWLTFALVQHTTNRRIAWIAAVLIALSPQNLYFGQELRFYSLLTLLTLGSVYLLILLRERFSWSRLLGFALVNGLLLNTQHLGLVILAAEALTIGWWATRSPERPLAGRLVVGLLITGVLYLPTLPTTLHQFSGRLGGEDQTGLYLKQDLIGTVNGVYRLGVGELAAGIKASDGLHVILRDRPTTLVTFVIAFLTLLWFLGYGLLSLSAEQRRTLMPYLVVAGVMVLAAVGSRQVGERASRNLYVLSPLYFGLLASGLAAAWEGKQQAASSTWWGIIGRVTSVALVGCILAGTVIHFQIIRRPGVNAIAQYIDAHRQPGDAVLDKGTYLHGESYVFTYYSKTDPPIVDYYGDYNVNLGNLAQLNAVPVQAEIDALLASHQRVWLYDLIGDPVTWRGTRHVLGTDKEGLELAVWEITR